MHQKSNQLNVFLILFVIYSQLNLCHSIKTIIDELFDGNVQFLRAAIRNLNFEPMLVKDKPSEFLKLGLHLSNGVLYGASNMTRAGEITASMDPYPRITGTVRIPNLVGWVNYAMRAPGYRHYGLISLTMQNVNVRFDINFNASESSINYADLSIVHMGKYDMTVDSRSESADVRKLMEDVITVVYKPSFPIFFEKAGSLLMQGAKIEVNRDLARFILSEAKDRAEYDKYILLPSARSVNSGTEIEHVLYTARKY